MMIRIREMIQSDAYEFAEIDKECFTIPWSQRAFEDEYKNEIAVYFAAECDGKCIGYAGFWNVSGESGITNIAVRNSFRRMGAGSRLLEAVIDRSVLLGNSVITLEVRSSNIGAKELYKKYGFEVIGLRKRYYSDNNEDAVIMAKTIYKENKSE